MTPEKKYQELKKEVLTTLEQFKNKLDNHEVKFKSDPNNWGYVGDMSYYLERLKELV